MMKMQSGLATPKSSIEAIKRIQKMSNPIRKMYERVDRRSSLEKQ